MATLGKLHEFKPDDEEFATYLERVEIFFAANGVEDTKKVPVFLNAIGGAAYGILRSLVAPSSPMSLSFKELTETLQAHALRAENEHNRGAIPFSQKEPAYRRVYNRLRS